MVVLLALFSNTDLKDRFNNSPDTTEPLDPLQTARAPRQAQHRLTKKEVDKLVKRYLEGASVPVLVEEFQINRVTALEHLERRGVPRRACVARLTGSDLTTAAELYAAGQSLAQVGKHFGVHGETVRRAFLKAELPVRPRR